MTRSQIIRRCLTCHAETWVSPDGLCPLWVIAATGIQLAEVIDEIPPRPCVRCGAREFQYRADRAYVEAAFERILRDSPALDNRMATFDAIWTAYQHTLASCAPARIVL